MMRRSVLCLALLAACAGRGAQVPKGSAGPPPVTLSVQVQAQAAAGGELKLLRPGAEVRAGDGLALLLDVDRRAYVYVSHVGPDGARRALFPVSGSPSLDSGRALRVPLDGEWLRLDEQAGEEILYAVVASYPLGLRDKALCAALGLYCPEVRSSDKKEPPPPPPPPNVTIDTRGLPKQADERTLRAQTDEWGVAVLRFPLRHRPR